VNWEVIGAIAEIVGATGVIVSLLYLATQIRQSTKVARAATRQALSQDLQSLGSDLINSDDMARIFHRHVSGSTVEPHELVRLQARAYRDFHFWDNAHYQFHEGMLPEEEWRGIRENLKQLMRYVAAYRDYWDGERSSFPTRFQQEVDRMLSESYAGEGSTVFEAFVAAREGGAPSSEG